MKKSFSSLLAAAAPPVLRDDPTPEAMPAPTQAAPMKSFLPDLDPNDPDHEEKSAIHRAYEQLARVLADNAPHVNFEEEYNKMAKARGPEPEKKSPNPLSTFAIAMGAGDKGVERQKQTYDEANDDSHNRWKEIARMKEEALKGDIQQKLSEGKFKQALAQSEILAGLTATQERLQGKRSHDQKMEEIKETNKGKTDVARIRADDAKARLQSRLDNLANSYNLEGKVRLAFFNAMLGGLGRRMSAQDITGEMAISPEDLKKYMDDAADMAETLSGEDFTKPTKRPLSLEDTPAVEGDEEEVDETPPPPKNETPAQRKLREIRERNKK